MPKNRQLIFDPAGFAQAVEGLSERIFEAVKDAPAVALVGIHTRGVPLMRRVAASLRSKNLRVDAGEMDVVLYRDDFTATGKIAQIKGNDIQFDIDGKEIILFDEVLYTGRTVRAALESLMDYGRPARVRLAVLVDRGLRELPIQPDFAGLVLETTAQDYVTAHFQETDGEDSVWITKNES